GRFITHLLRLKNVHTALANFFASGVLALGSKLGPFLWQLPEKLPFDAEMLDQFLGQLPRSTDAAARLARDHDERLDGRNLLVTDGDRPLRHALEVRSQTFDTPEFFAVLERHNIASVVADTAGKWPFFLQQTADFSYARLHGETIL